MERENPYNASVDQGQPGGYVNVIMRAGEGRGGVALVLSHQLRKAEGGGPTATTTVCPLPPRPRPVETAETGLVSAGAF